MLKIVELRAAVENLDPLSDSMGAAVRALVDEEHKAHELEQQFFNEFDDDERDSGLCNARDTFVENGAYRAHESAVEKSAEFWKCAIDSAQAIRDSRPRNE